MMRMKSTLLLACLLIGITSGVEIALSQIEPSRQLQDLRIRPPSPPNLGGTGFTPPKVGGGMGPPLGMEGTGGQKDGIYVSPDLALQQKKPPISGRPPEREPAGTRGPCENTDISFTPLLPVSNTKNRFSGLTLSGHPTFWFYIPYKTSSVRAGKFALEDEQGNPVYRTFFKLPDTPGLVSVNVPATAKGLEKNKPYRWTFMLYCESIDPAEPLPVWHTGTVQRIDMPALETQLKKATLEKRINLYTEHKIWYDASTDLAQIRNSPQAWLNLLKATDLEQLSQVAIAGPVVPIDVENYSKRQKAEGIGQKDYY